MTLREHKFVIVPISNKMRTVAESRAAFLAKKKIDDPTSIRNGNGVFLGFLAEEVIKYIIGPTAIPSSGKDVYNYDLLIGSKKYEIKAKEVNKIPSSDEECSIYDSNTRQECDYYVFVRILKEKNEYVTAYISGFIKKADFFTKARFIKKGTQGTNRVRRTGELYVYPSDVHNIYIYQLPYQFKRKKK